MNNLMCSFAQKFCRHQDREWQKRFDDDCGAGGDGGDSDADLSGQLIEAGYRALAQKLHPDHGGSMEVMQRLNALVAKLRRGVLAA